MAEEIPILTRSLTVGPLDEDEREILSRLPGLTATGAPAPAGQPGTTPDATVVLDGTTVRLGPAATAAVLELLGRLASGAAVTVSEQDRWLNTSQAARLAGVSNTYLRQLADRGEIPVTYRGTHRRIHPDDVLAWVRQRGSGEVGTPGTAEAAEYDSQDSPP
ncbi:helix-turn-helix domain-containing protein [Citricoccus muralis]|uniref:Excisionase family DNA binding protein n=1 Tax=Citricoccus muralis TaxID=169134 RepID=A0A3D9LHG5_9MICC|nr:helix-turn-helix domain-containing protein [Citricoccus muralis]REE04897.1 excisionase family DNA binding protein [Citricoccus muralis]